MPCFIALFRLTLPVSAFMIPARMSVIVRPSGLFIPFILSLPFNHRPVPAGLR